MHFSFESMAIDAKELDFERTVFLIESFLVSQAITMIYGPPSQGKTWFMLGMSKLLAPRMKKIFYIDFDNPKRQLKERGVDKLLEEYSTVKYFSKGGLSISQAEFLADIDKNAFGENYTDCLFIVDSTRDFVDNIHNDTQVKAFMQKMKNIRDAGGTVVLIHHATKNGRVIDGSGEFAKSADNVYELRQKARIDSVLQYQLRVENDRDAIIDCGFSVDTKTLKLDVMDRDIAMMSEYEEEFVNRGREALHKNPAGLGQTELLKYIGYEKTDKTARDTLDKFTEKFWLKHQEKKGKPITYTAI